MPLLPAARVGDMHICPMVTGTIPHVGGPILPGARVDVLIQGLPAAKDGDMCTCTGPPDFIIGTSASVLINGRPAARLLDPTQHGGMVQGQFPMVLIGD